MHELVSIASIAAPGKYTLVGGPFGSRLTSRDYLDVGIPVIRGTNMSGGVFLTGDYAFVSDAKAQELRGNLAYPGDIIFTQRGTLGQVAVVPQGIYDRFVVSQSQMKLTVDPCKAEPRFIYYLFLDPQVSKGLTSRAASSGVPHINLTVLREFEVRLPALHTQRRIAAILSAFDDLIENNSKRIKLLDEIARALYQEWFVRFRFPGHEEVKLVDSPLGQIPDTWETGQLVDIVTLQRGFDITKNEQRPGRYWVISSSGPKSCHAEFKVEGPGVIIGRKGSLGTVFRTFAPYWPHDTTLWVKDFHGHGHLFAFHLLRSLDLGRFDSGAANPTLNRNHIHKLALPCPPTAISHQFEERVGPMMRLADTLGNMNERLAEARNFLLPQLISGDIDVDNLDLPEAAE